MRESNLLTQCRQALELARERGADGIEVFGQTTRNLTSTIEKNDLQISKSRQETRIGVRAFLGDRVGFASTNDLTKLEDAATDAVILAKASPGDPHNVLPEPNGTPSVDGVYDPTAESFTTEDAVRYAIRMLEFARSMDSRVIVGDGEFSAEIQQRAVVNSSGFEVEERGSTFTYYLLTTAKEGERVSNFDFQFGASRIVSEIDVEPVTRRACENALGSLGAEKGESFKGQILLTPSAVHQILEPVLTQINARNVLRGMSRWKDSIGTAVAAPSLTWVDDGRLPGGIATSSFDREGVPHQRLTVIESGILRSFLHNTYTAHAFRIANTGHAIGSAGSLPGIGPTNLMILPGDLSKDALVSEIKQGLLVSRFSGNSDPISGDFSGVAKGAHLIKNGKIARPVSGSLIAGNVFEALKNLSGISKERERVFNFIYPYLRLKDVSVTAE